MASSVKNMRLRSFIIAALFSLAVSCIKCSSINSRPPKESPEQPPPQNESKLENTSSVDNAKSAFQLILHAQSGINTLKSIHQSLFNSSQVLEMEGNIHTQLKIIGNLYTSYGVTLASPTWQKCSEMYWRRKQVLLMELKSMEMLCMKSIEAVKTKDFQDQGVLLPSAFLKLCGDEALNLYLNAQDLISNQYFDSLGCALEVSTRTLTELAMTNYFDHVDRKNMLLTLELQYLLDKFGEYAHGSFPVLKRKALMAQFIKFYKELKAIMMKKNGRALQAEVTMFKESVENIPSLKSDTFSKGKSNVSDYISTQIFEKYLKMEEITEAIRTRTSLPSPRQIRKVMRTHGRLIEMIFEITDKFPGSFLKGNENETEPILFSGISETLGKQCENSPNHLAGTCTSENNEICRMAPEWRELDLQARNIRMDNVVVSEFMLLTKYCTCGFHEDCAPIAFTYQVATEHSTCFLIPNSYGQCRGGVGYPCGTLPLAKGEFDKSCASERCNLVDNECA